jgi:phosphoglycerate dehydrogenase-like enzyme
MAERKPISRVVVALGQEPADIARLVDRFPEIDFVNIGGDELATHAPEADALLIGWVANALTRESAPRLQWIQTAGAGVEHYIEEGLVGEGIILTNGSGVMAPNMAEYAVGMMVAFARQFPALWRGQERHEWRPGLGLDSFFELGDQTVLFVGLGDIALETAKRLAGFGMHTIGVRRTVHTGDLPFGIDRVVTIDDLDDILPVADHVLSSVPSTKATRHLFDAERFTRFKQGAYFYNLGAWHQRGTGRPDCCARVWAPGRRGT